MGTKDSEIWEAALISVINKEIGPPGVAIVKNRLLEKYGTTIRQSFQKWEQVEDILKENFGEGYITINSKLIKEISKTKTKYGQKPFDPENQNLELIKLIGDPEVGLMLDQVLEHSKIIKDIILDAKVSQTTAYRKIEKMKQVGLLIENGFIISPSKKKIVKYTSPFRSYSIIHKNGEVTIKYGPKKIIKNIPTS